jgi:ssDNA-binding Zn-finger/Zn-ribbon topoisomerase 1
MGFANLAKPRLSGLHYSQRLHTARVQARAELTGTLLCPLFEKPMRRRTVGKTHGQFWCCPAYPNCKGTQDIEA